MSNSEQNIELDIDTWFTVGGKNFPPFFLKKIR